MVPTLVALAVVALIAHYLFAWAAPHVLNRVPNAPPEQREALLRYSRKKLWFGFLCGAMGALIVVAAGQVATLMR